MTQTPRLYLRVLEGRHSVCHLGAAEKVPVWAANAKGFWSATRTADELSVVCAEAAVPPGTKCETGWRIFQIEGPLDFSLIGILVSVATPLAGAKVSIFSISTYDTDYVFVKEPDLEKAIGALTAAGHTVRRQG
jgi:hypothetical protein